MTTLREQLNLKKRRLVIAMYLGFGVMAVGMGIASTTKSVPWLALIGVVVASAVGLYGLAAIRCPACKARIGYFVMYGGSLFSISKNFKYCPSCAMSLDTRENQV